MREQSAIAQRGTQRTWVASGGLLFNGGSDFPVLMAIQAHVVAPGETVAFEFFRRQRGAGHQGKLNIGGSYFAKSRPL